MCVWRMSDSMSRRRFPSRDPQPGDHVRCRKGHERLVVRREGDDVYYIQTSVVAGRRTKTKFRFGEEPVYVCYLTTWRNWAKLGKILQTVEDVRNRSCSEG